jgi:hypothetical protein
MKSRKSSVVTIFLLKTARVFLYISRLGLCFAQRVSAVLIWTKQSLFLHSIEQAPFSLDIGWSLRHERGSNQDWTRIVRRVFVSKAFRLFLMIYFLYIPQCFYIIRFWVISGMCACWSLMVLARWLSQCDLFCWLVF